MLGVLAMATAFTSCSSDDDDDWNDDGSKLVLPKSRAYIMNQGTQSENNSGIEFYAFTSRTVPVLVIRDKP